MGANNRFEDTVRPSNRFEDGLKTEWTGNTLTVRRQLDSSPRLRRRRPTAPGLLDVR